MACINCVNRAARSLSNFIAAVRRGPCFLIFQPLNEQLVELWQPQIKSVLIGGTYRWVSFIRRSFST